MSLVPKVYFLPLAAVVSVGLSIAPPAYGEIYKADLAPLNATRLGSSPQGEATFEVNGASLTVHIVMRGVPANIEHWEHFHGFPSGEKASCATAAMDANSDGIIDLLETGRSSGTTMVPFNDRPEDMIIPTHTYPHANSEGHFEYTRSVPLDKLNETFGRVYKGGKIDLDKRVLYVHGVPMSPPLPQSVGSLGPISSHVTLPIACGEIVKVSD